jgi:threonine/homoserine/homoserine lactone efflux protein
VHDPTVFALSVLALLAVPGPTNTLLAGAGATLGFARSLPLLVGELAGYTIAIATYRYALATRVSESGDARLFLQWAIGAYLIVLALRLWRAAPRTEARGFTIPRVFLTTLLNPKALIFALALFPAAPAPVVGATAGFSIMVVCVGACWIAAGAFAIQLTSTRYRHVAPRICALALAVFAVMVMAGSFR